MDVTVFPLCVICLIYLAKIQFSSDTNIPYSWPTVLKGDTARFGSGSGKNIYGSVTLLITESNSYISDTW